MAELVAIKDITIEEGLHCRDGLNMDAVSRYSEILDALPPIKLVRDGDTLLLASGHHRYESYAKAGIDELPAEVTVGTRLDAIKIGLKDNLQHGVPLARNERNRAIVMLADEDLPHREIGEIFGLGDDAVGVIARKAGRRRRNASINEKGKETRDADGQDPKVSGPTTPEEILAPGESIPAAQGAATYQPERLETENNGTAGDASLGIEEASPAVPSPMAGLSVNLREPFMISLLPGQWIGLVNAAAANPDLAQDELAVAAVQLVKARFANFGIPWERVDDATLEDIDPLPPTDEKTATEEGGLPDQHVEATEGAP
jgi:hypothetical protein